MTTVPLYRSVSPGTCRALARGVLVGLSLAAAAGWCGSAGAAPTGYDDAAGLRARLGAIHIASAEQAGAKGDGRTDDTAVLQAWLDTPGAVLQLTPGRTYRLTRSLTLHSGTAIVGFGMKPGRLLLSAAGFDCDTAAGCRDYDLDPHAVGLFMRGPHGAKLSNIVLDDFAIAGEGAAQQGKTIMAISCSNVANLRISRLDISRLSNSIGVRCSGLSGASMISNNVFHDFFDGSPGPLPNIMAAISIDLDAGVGAPHTTHLLIDGNHIANIRYGPAFTAKYLQQASGIVVTHGTGPSPTTGIVATHNVVVGTGQGVDWHASKGRVAGNIIKDADLYCLKFIHGASDNVVTGNSLDGCGIAGISLGGGNNAVDVARNRIYGNTIRHIDPHGIYAKNDTAGILLLRSIANGVSVDNQVGPNNIDVGNGAWVIGDFAAGNHGNVLIDSAGAKPGRSGLFKVLPSSDMTR